MPTVAFLCVHNAGRSQMAAAWLEHLAGDRVEVLTGGSDPAGVLNPAAVAAMKQIGIEMGGRAPRLWDEAELRGADLIVTMGCGETCPVVPGARYEDWPVADPHGAARNEVTAIRTDIEHRVRDLIRRLEL